MKRPEDFTGNRPAALMTLVHEHHSCQRIIATVLFPVLRSCLGAGRKEYLRKLESIQQERQRLNIEAMSSMLPQVPYVLCHLSAFGTCSLLLRSPKPQSMQSVTQHCMLLRA